MTWMMDRVVRGHMSSGEHLHERLSKVFKQAESEDQNCSDCGTHIRDSFKYGWTWTLSNGGVVSAHCGCKDKGATGAHV
jgi:hypothetical protein